MTEPMNGIDPIETEIRSVYKTIAKLRHPALLGQLKAADEAVVFEAIGHLRDYIRIISRSAN